MKSVAFVIVAAAIVSGAASAQTIKREAIKPTPASNPQKMFDSYCAACHGKDGTGTGPAAKALSKAPADLTRIAARNGGTFPEVHVKRYIEGLDEVAAHGTRDMPMWGDLFSSLDRSTKDLRVQALSDYIKSMQHAQ